MWLSWRLDLYFSQEKKKERKKRFYLSLRRSGIVFFFSITTRWNSSRLIFADFRFDVPRGLHQFFLRKRVRRVGKKRARFSYLSAAEAWQRWKYRSRRSFLLMACFFGGGCVHIFKRGSGTTVRMRLHITSMYHKTRFPVKLHKPTIRPYCAWHDNGATSNLVNEI